MERISYQDIPAGMFEKLMSIEDMINHSSLDKQLLEIIKLRVSQINSCAYCVDMHYKELKHLGESELRMYSLSVWQETGYFSKKEQVVLDFTEKLTLVEKEGIPESVFQSLTHYFNKQEIAFLTLAIAQINTWTRLMKAFQFTPGNYSVRQEN